MRDRALAFMRRWLLPIVVLAAMLAVFLSGGWDYLRLETLARHSEALHRFVSERFLLSLFLYLSLYAVCVALSLPGGALLTITSGFLFGAFLGGTVALFAAVLGATALFLIARTALGEGLSARAGPWLEKLRDGFARNALSYMLFLRLVPAFPFWLVNLAPALLNVRLSVYLIGTFFGIIPGTFAFAFLGGGLDAILAQEMALYEACLSQRGEAECAFSIEPAALLSRELLLAFTLLGVVALTPVGFRLLRRARFSSRAADAP